jgi:hypothetical protein
MSNTKRVYESLMKIVVRIADVVALAKRFEESAALARRSRYRLTDARLA